MRALSVQNDNLSTTLTLARTRIESAKPPHSVEQPLPRLSAAQSAESTRLQRFTSNALDLFGIDDKRAGGRQA